MLPAIAPDAALLTVPPLDMATPPLVWPTIIPWLVTMEAIVPRTFTP